MMKVSWRSIPIALAVCAACVSEPEVDSSEHAIQVDEPLALDVLFVIDKSGSMQEERISMAENFELMINELSTLPGGLPSLHIGVISSDMGIGNSSIALCSETGDDGALQNAPRVEDCAPPDDAFIADVIGPDGVRQRNYTGTLEETFQCIGLLGTDGCGFEQHLASMRRALETTGAGEQNEGFLRQDAYLAVVFVTDEDDCSARDVPNFDADPANDATLGPLGSFRCAEFGLRCDGQSLTRTSATYATCEPRGDSYLHHPDDYESFLTDLKGGTDKVFVGVIAGESTGLAVEVVDNGGGPRPLVQASCNSVDGVAAPSHRLSHFAESFPLRHVTSICNPSLDIPISNVAKAMTTALAPADPKPDPGDPGDDPLEPDEETSGGCQSTAASAPAFWLVAFFALGLLWRRRRSR